MSIPKLDAVRALNGRIYAMLNRAEVEVLSFYIAQGRKFEVAVSIENKADSAELAAASSPAHADEIMKRANSLVRVKVGPGAEAAWAARA